ncbi:MAG TPA: PAS domain S-box protein [Terriglobales bacterium]|nr:PAS domain S-box protein [Terriglobales bacterium]
MSDSPEFQQRGLLKALYSSADARQLFSALLESAPDAMLIVDERGNILLANSQTEKLFGYRWEELVGQPVEMLMPPRFRDGHAQHRGHFFAAPRLRPMGAGLDLYGLRRDGSEFPVEISLNPIASEGGTLITSSIRDVSDRKRADQELRRAYAELDQRVLERTAELEKLTTALLTRIGMHEQTENELRQSEERFRLLVEGAKDYAIFMLNPEGRVVSWNAAAERIYGFTAEEAIGSSLSRFHPPEDQHAETPQYALEQAAATGRFEEENWRTRKDGQRFWASTVTTALRDERGNLRGFSRITRDVTERRELEHRLRHAQKLEAIGRLAGGVAHEFNNSATAILGYSSLVIDQAQDNQQLRHYAEEIHKAGQRAASVTRQLLAFSRQQILQPTMLSLNEVVADIEKMLRGLIGEDIRLLTTLDPYLGVVKADSGEMEQVIINLVLNARDAMPDGGVMHIETSNVEVDHVFAAENPDMAPGPHVRLRVTDTGIGLDKQTAAHIFEPFFTTKPVGQGTGLGLSTVYGTVKRSGGGILVFSEPGRGATFEIYLPRLEQALVKPAILFPRRKPDGGSETILIVEDDSSLRWLTVQILTQFGYTVLEAGDGSQALALAEERAGNIDILLTDVVMPGCNGRQLARQVEQLYPQIKVLLMSGYTAEIVAQQDGKEIALAFLEKPCTPEELGLKVREVLGQSDAPRLRKRA